MVYGGAICCDILSCEMIRNMIRNIFSMVVINHHHLDPIPPEIVVVSQRLTSTEESAVLNASYHNIAGILMVLTDVCLLCWQPPLRPMHLINYRKFSLCAYQLLSYDRKHYQFISHY